MREQCYYCGAVLEADWVGCPSCGHARLNEGEGDGSRTETDRATPKHRPTADTSRALAFLVLKTGAGEAGSTFALGESTNIGRDPKSNQIVVDDPHVSRQHGRVRLERGSFFYYDLASRSGSWLASQNGNERRISGPVRLVQGDILHMGLAQLVFMEASQ